MFFVRANIYRAAAVALLGVLSPLVAHAQRDTAPRPQLLFVNTTSVGSTITYGTDTKTLSEKSYLLAKGARILSSTDAEKRTVIVLPNQGIVLLFGPDSEVLIDDLLNPRTRAPGSNDVTAQFTLLRGWIQIDASEPDQRVDQIVEVRTDVARVRSQGRFSVRIELAPVATVVAMLTGSSSVFRVGDESTTPLYLLPAGQQATVAATTNSASNSLLLADVAGGSMTDLSGEMRTTLLTGQQIADLARSGEVSAAGQNGTLLSATIDPSTAVSASTLSTNR